MKTRMAVVSAVLIVLFAGSAWAQTGELQPGVARVSLIHGDVSMQRGDSGDWVVTSLNAPVVAGDYLSAGTRSRLELQLDYANVLRVDERSEVKVADLTRTHEQIQVRRGRVNFTVFKDSESDVEIDTPNVSIRPLREGSYRIEVLTEETKLIVRKGEAEVTTPEGSTTANKGDMIVIRGTDHPEYRTQNAPRSDSWDEWNKERDHEIWDARSWGHANRYYTGAYELDRHGRWVYVPGYGMVWAPDVEPDWAPYRYGRWVWEPYWGWTWVSYEPWGWAPYHYGRWFIHAGSWCWWPGPVYRAYRPIWAPAYVSFIGFGHGGHFSVGVGLGFGSIGWVPIGPSDYFYPWWGAHRRTVNVINVTNITNITNIRNVHGAEPVGPLARGFPRNASNLNRVVDDPRLRHAVTSMPMDDFGRGPVPRNHRLVTADDLRGGQVVAGAVPVVPTNASLKTVDRNVNPGTVPRDNGHPERFFTKSQPTYRPQPFRAEAEEVHQTLQGPRAEVRDATGPSQSRVPADRARTDAAPEARNAQADGQRWRGFGGDRNSNIGGDRNVSDRRAPATQPQTAPPAARENVAGEPRRDAAASGNDSPRSWQSAAVHEDGQSGTQQQPRQSTRDSESSGWHKFSGPRRADRNADNVDRGQQRNAPGTERERSADGPRPQAERTQRSTSAPAVNSAPERRPAQETAPARQGWERFTRRPEVRSAGEPRRGMESPERERSSAPEVRREQPRTWQAPAARQETRSERPPLDVRKPIVTPRAERQAPRGNSGDRGASRSSQKPQGPARDHR